MKLISKLLHNYKVQLLVICLAGLLCLKIVALNHTNFYYYAFNEVILLFVIYFAVINGAAVFARQKMTPVPIVVGIAIAGLINLLTLQNGDNYFKMFSMVSPEKSSPSLILTINSIYTLIVVLPTIFVFLALRTLFFYKQKRNLQTYFSSFTIFLILSSVTAFLKLEAYHKLVFIHYAFAVMTYILAVLNAGRIAWITFLPKKQKVRLLLMATGIIIIFSMNLGGLANEIPEKFLEHFSPGISNFMRVVAVYGLLYFIFLFFITLFHLPTAEAIDRKTKEVSSLQNLSRLINQVFDPKELMATVTDLASQMSNADASWIILHDRNSHRISAPQNIGLLEAEQISQKLISMLPAEFAGVRLLDAPPHVKREKSELRFNSAAVAAIKSHAFKAGLLVSIRRSEIPFDDDDRNSLEAFADNVAIAFENSRLLQESIEKERLEKELDVAREMQRKLIPESIPEYRSLKISAAFIPAFEVGGDYYDFFELGEGKLGFVIADVSGKGISAAFIMAEIRGIFEILSSLHTSPKELLCKVNGALDRTLDKHNFITAIYGIVDERKGTMVFARAGHTPVLLARGGVITTVLPKGIGLGLTYSSIFDDSLDEYEITLQQDDTLLFFTDGIPESMNENNEEFGMPRLSRLLLEQSSNEPGVIQNHLLESLTVFSQNMQQHDDITALLFKWDTTNLESVDGRISDSNE